MFERWRWSFGAATIAAILFTFVTASGVWAQRMIPALGQGTIEITVFSDYFCPPCKSIDAQAEPLFRELLATGKVKLKFIDVPIRHETKFYNKYYLYAANDNPTVENILNVRSKLFDAAQEKRILLEADLLGYLNRERIRLKPMDEKSVHPLLSAAIKENKIDQTPTCIVRYSATDVRKWIGTDEIWKGLNALKTHLEKVKR